MDGHQGQLQLERKFQDVIDRFRVAGILMGHIHESFDPIQIINDRPHFEMRKSVPITGVIALTDQVPFMGARRSVAQDNVFQLGIQMRYQIDSELDTENMTYTIREFIADNIDHDAFLELEPDEDVCEAVMRCAVFTNEDQMMRYIAFRTIQVMSSKYRQNCLLSLGSDSVWVFTYKPHRIKTTGRLYWMNKLDESLTVEDSEPETIERELVCDIEVQGRFIQIGSDDRIPEEFIMSRRTTFFVPSYLQNEWGSYSSAVLGSCDFCQEFANYIAHTIINL